MEQQLTYREAIERLENLGAFHQVGVGAYHPGLENIRALDNWAGNPAASLICIHVAGTNGKGSTSSLIASVLTAAGYRTGLYTSPHLVDMRERIRVDGVPVTKEFVADFTSRLTNGGCPVAPSYFEALSVMAFEWFRLQKVDVAVIEVGLGGRLDSTNIITPLLSVITNISLDHTAILGDTPEAIAAEKAGIIKPGVPVVVGHASECVRNVFRNAVREVNAGPGALIFAEDIPLYTFANDGIGRFATYVGTPWGTIHSPLTGSFQHENAATVFNSLVQLSAHFDISPEAVHKGFADVAQLSGLAARWMECRFNDAHFIIDTGHNPGAWEHLGPRLSEIADRQPLKMVVGFLRDKDLGAIIPMMPRKANYFFVTPGGDRARSAEETAALFAASGMHGTVCHSVEDAVIKASKEAAAEGCVFVGGSTFVASAFMSLLSQKLTN